MIGHSGLTPSIPTEPAPISNAKLAAELQALALAIRIGGLEGLRSGALKTVAARNQALSGEVNQSNTQEIV